MKVISADGSALESWTVSEYHDNERFVIVKSDMDTVGDGRKVAIQHFDQLGRVRLSRTLEHPESEDPTDEQDGIKVETKYKASGTCTFDNTKTCSFQITSNPFRAATASAATGEETMGWTMSESRNDGRYGQVQTFAGAALPSPFGGSNSNSTGIVKTTFESNATTVEDQAGKLRRSIVNGIGQLIRVDEPNSSNQLGTVSSPNQDTSYTYDVLNNLTTVTQGSQTRTFTYSSLSRLLTAANPESGTMNYVYDANGNLTRKTDARGVQTDYVYDALNRVTNRNYSTPGGTPANYQASPNVTYTYGTTAPVVGKLTKVSSSVSTTEFTSFDILGRVTGAKQTTDGGDSNGYTTAYSYKLNGTLDEETYPSSRVVKTVVDSNGELASVESKKTSSAGYWHYADNISYGASGFTTSMQMGNGLWESVQRNGRLQPLQIALGQTQNSDSLWKINYEFGELQSSGNVDVTKNNGNVGKQTITVPTIGAVSGFVAVQSISYDDLKRIKTATETVNSSQTWKQTFNYDRFGNRTFDAANTTTIPTGCTTAVCNPAIDSSNNRIATSQGYSFDSNGNVTQNADNGKFVYDANNEIVEVRDASSNSLIDQNFFDGDGERVKITANGETTVFVHDVFGKAIAEYSSETPTTSPKVSYMTDDLLGSPRVITDENGRVAARHDFTPFGEEVGIGTGGRSTAQSYGPTNDIRQKFTGQERDSDVNLDYFNARHFAYALGRFMSPDNFGGKLSNPQSLNLYAYALNNPLKWVDPTGHAASDPDDCKDKNGVENCTADKNNGNVVKKPDGSDYFLPGGPDMVVNTSGGETDSGPTDQSWRQLSPPDLPESVNDLAPVWGSFRRMVYNMNCRTGGCNIGRATMYFIQTGVDAATLWRAAGEIFAEEVIEETAEVGATTAIRNTAEEAPSSLYDDSITRPGSVRNVQTDVTPSEFTSNLEKNGFSRSLSKDGAITNLEKGSLKYSIRPKAVGQTPPSVNVFKNGSPMHKIRLKL